jgi:protein CpxP
MKLKRTFLSVAMAAALLGGSAIAQTAPEQPAPGTKRAAAKGNRTHARRAMAALNLTDAQKQQMKDLRQRQNEATKGFRAEHQQLRAELQEATKAGNAARIEALSQQLGTVQGKLRVAALESQNQIRSILTPEQQTQWDQMRQHRQGKQGRRGPRG